MDYLENLEIDPTAHIAPSATVIGDVKVGAECTVLQGATIRGDFGGRIEIGKQTNIQENCCIHVNQRRGHAHRRQGDHRAWGDRPRLRRRRGHADRHGSNRDRPRQNRLAVPRGSGCARDRHGGHPRQIVGDRFACARRAPPHREGARRARKRVEGILRNRHRYGAPRAAFARKRVQPPAALRSFPIETSGES